MKYVKLYDNETEYNNGFDDALEGRKCAATSLDYNNGYRKGREVAAINGGSK